MNAADPGVAAACQSNSWSQRWTSEMPGMKRQNGETEMLSNVYSYVHPANSVEQAYLESLIREDFERCHPGETLEDVKRRASFSKEAPSRLDGRGDQASCSGPGQASIRARRLIGALSRRQSRDGPHTLGLSTRLASFGYESDAPHAGRS
jgi:hypothetical protein